MPRAHWTTLFQLEAIKQRSKPKEPPKKRPLAPFFLPSVISNGGSTPSFPTPQEYQKILEQQPQQESKDQSFIDSKNSNNSNSRDLKKRAVVEVIEEEEGEAAGDVNLPSLWADEEGDPSGWVIDTTRDDSVLVTDEQEDVAGNGNTENVDFVIASGDNDLLAVSKKASNSRLLSKIFNKSTTLPRLG